MAGVYYLQRFVGIERGGYSDIRVLVAHGRVLAAMTRRAEHWITNVKLGGRPEPVAIDTEMQDLALRAAAAVEADFAGVDLLRSADGRLTVIEVNSMPGWQGLQSVTDFPIAEELARILLERYGLAPAPPVVLMPVFNTCRQLFRQFLRRIGPDLRQRGMVMRHRRQFLYRHPFVHGGDDFMDHDG